MEWPEALDLMRAMVRKLRSVMNPQVANQVRRFTLLDATSPHREIKLLGRTLHIPFPVYGVSDRAVSLALRGEPHAWDVVSDHVAAKLRKREALTNKERDFAAGVLEGKTPTRKRGRDPRVEAWIGRGIRELVEYGVELGFPATRNDASPPLSACDLVAEAMKAEGLSPRTFAAVKAIWTGRSR